MRVYLTANREQLEALRRGEPLTLPPVVPDSEDEADEYAALSAAAETGPVVVAADIENEFEPLSLDQVASFHVDADGTGDLAWYATQELDQVIDLL
jgi:hypothetical protein